jgi:membrane protease YdiL (CAAX protease family)
MQAALWCVGRRVRKKTRQTGMSGKVFHMEAPLPKTVHDVFYNSRGLRPGWRLAIFFLMVFGTAALVQILVRLGGPTSPASGSRASSPYMVPIGNGIAELVLFLVILLFSWIMSKIEHRSVGEYGLPVKKGVFTKFITGYVLWGFLPLVVLLSIMRLLGVFYFGNLSLHGKDIVIWGVLWGFMFLMVGFFEEYSFRGYALHTLIEGIGFWPAALIMALAFARVHMGNGGETRVGIIATGVFALFAAAILRRTGDLWLAVGAHAGWDWGQTYFFGVNDSGLQAPGHLLNPSQSGPAWLSGGSVGPEGSVLTLILWAVMFVLFLVIYRGKSEPELVVSTNPITTFDAGRRS